ncbi:hypothetical protein [Ferrovum myxofaciens]|uniref:hypothetical protein n=1 Tax=Ferrovum myxofaciens TaxID=416213 RepID=UPI0023551F20|nr:hypothetical protein [Ferrovum myxofaciens]
MLSPESGPTLLDAANEVSKAVPPDTAMPKTFDQVALGGCESCSPSQAWILEWPVS